MSIGSRGQGLRRRVFLGGAAAIVGLPFLESAIGRSTRRAQAQVTTAPPRLLYVYIPNGLDMATFRPADTGTNYTLSPMLEPLAAHRSNFSVITGLENANGAPEGAGDHASGTAAFITCAKANKSDTDIQLGISADQVAAGVFGGETRLPSLQLGVNAGSPTGNCDGGYACAYTRNISWASSTTPLPRIFNPPQVFEQLFQGYDPEESAAEAEKRRAYHKSILDFVVDDVNSLNPKLGATDRQKLDEYLTGIRQLENKLVAEGPGVTCDPGEVPPQRTDLDFQGHLRAMMDLITLAFSCDATRIMSFMCGPGIDWRTFPSLGITSGHHDLSHHQNDPVKIAQLAQIGHWYMGQIAYLFSQLSAVSDGPEGESLLHNSAVFVSSDVSDGNRHNHDDMPIILGGHAGGRLSTGRHLNFPTDNGKEKVSNLLVTMLHTAGVEGATLGDSDGLLPDLLT